MSLSASARQRLFFFLTYDIFAIGLLVYVLKSNKFRGGPCNLGFDFAVAALYFFIGFILLLVGSYHTSKNQENKYLVIISIISIAIGFLLSSI